MIDDKMPSLALDFSQNARYRYMPPCYVMLTYQTTTEYDKNLSQCEIF